MKPSGPDSIASWVIAGACCFINMVLFGMARLAGVLFVASVPRFQVTRQKASFPYTFSSFMRNTSGPLVGYLGNKFGVRAVTTFGCILGAIGAGTCYFAENINTVTVLWGVVFGLGFGMGNVLLPVSINQHFDKHRATASGISFSGACLGSFILPAIVEILLNKYGLSGTFLFLSGFILNCAPAALLLRKPDFEIKNSKCSDIENSETQSIVSGMKVKLYTAENSPESLSISKTDKNIHVTPKFDSKDVICQNLKDGEIESDLTYEERINRLSTQTLLLEHSIHINTSEPLDEKIENSKGRRQADQSGLDAEVLNLSRNTDKNGNSEKDEVFKKENLSSSVHYERPISSEFSNVNRTVSSESLVSETPKSFAKTLKEGYANYGYQVEVDDLKLDFAPNSIPQKNIQRHSDTQSSSNEVYFNYTYHNNDKFLTEKYKSFPSNLNNLPKSSKWPDIDNFKVRHGVLPHVPNKEKDIDITEKSSSLGSFSIIFDPTFLMIAITNAIYNFTFVCMITVIVDYARDLNIGTSNEKYILMAFSVGDLIGHVGFGWVTDCGYMTATSFAAFCFACQGITTSAIALSDGFITLMTLSALYGLSEAGIIVIYPIIVAQFIDEDKQTVAIPSSYFLSGPVCLAVAPVIGYFRDDIGSYDYIFYGIGILSAICCLGLLILPFIARCRRQM